MRVSTRESVFVVNFSIENSSRLHLEVYSVFGAKFAVDLGFLRSLFVTVVVTLGKDGSVSKNSV